jgi:hypothetical protein
MPAMSAFQLRNPVTLIVLIESKYFTFHLLANVISGVYFSGAAGMG